MLSTATKTLILTVAATGTMVWGQAQAPAAVQSGTKPLRDSGALWSKWPDSGSEQG